MRIIDTGITKEMLSGDDKPQITIAGKNYIVDNRQSTFKKIQDLNDEETLENVNKDYATFELALGKEAADEITAMDLPVDKYTYLSYCVMGAITGEDPKRLQEMSRKNL